MKPKTYTQVVILIAVISFVSLADAYGLQINITSWIGTEQVAQQPDLRLVTSVVVRSLNIYSNILEGPRPIRLEVRFQDLGETACANGGPEIARNIPGLPSIWYPDPLASQLTNTDIPSATAYQASITINSRMVNQHDFDYSLTPNVPGDKIDFLNVMLHELGHCMGFTNLCNDNGSWLGGTMDLHSWFLEYEDFLGDYVWFALLNQAERDYALASDALYWQGDYVAAYSSYYFQVYAPWSSSENNASHWDPWHFPDELMEPQVVNNLRYLGTLIPALRDLGWSVRPIFVVPSYIELMATLSKSGSSQPVFITSNRSVTTSITLSITGPQASEFVASGVPGTSNLLPYKTRTVTVSGAPASLGYKMATLRAEYNDGTAQVVEVALSMFVMDSDTDGDGMSDVDETRDLDGAEGDIDNPFNSSNPDSTGDNRGASADGVDDGYNDWDWDGMSNMEEFMFGYNPIDPYSYGVRTSLDTDGDGISDVDETRDLFGMGNPFDPYNGDSTGDHPYEDNPDGTADGQNDYDGDGQSNSYEFQCGSNPLDPNSNCAGIPVSTPTAMGIAVLILLWFGRSRLGNRTNGT